MLKKLSIRRPFEQLQNRTLLLIIFAVALTFRTLYFFSFRQTPYYDYLFVDAQGYDLQALNIVNGNWLGTEVFFQDPLYPYFLAIVYYFFDHSYLAVYLIQAFLGCISCIVLALVTARVYNQNRYRKELLLLSGIASAICTPVIYYDFLILKTSLTVFLTLSHLYILVYIFDSYKNDNNTQPPPPSTKNYAYLGLLGGILLGLNILNRGNYILLTPVFIAWLVWNLRKQKGANSSLLPKQNASVILGCYLIAIALTILPVTYRNYIVGGEWVLATSQGGVNLYLGNNPNSDGALSRPEEVQTNPLTERYDYLRVAERETKRKLNWSEMNDYYLQKASKWMIENPLDAFKLFLRKWQLWFAGKEIADNYSYDFIQSHYIKSLSFSPINGYTISLLGWLGVFVIFTIGYQNRSNLLSTAHPKLQLITLFTLVYSISVTLFYIKSRLRIPIYPMLIILGSGTIVWLLSEAKKHKSGEKLLVLLVSCALLIVVFRSVYQPNWPYSKKNINGTQYFNLGTMYLANHEPELALASFEKAENLITSNFSALNMIARIYLNFGLKDKVYKLYRTKTAQNPNYTSGLYNLGYLAFQDSNYKESERALTQLKNISSLQINTLPPEAPLPDLLLGDISIINNNYELALKHYRNYVSNSKGRLYSNPGYQQVADTLINSKIKADQEMGLTVLLLTPENRENTQQWQLKRLQDYKLNPTIKQDIKILANKLFSQKKLNSDNHAKIIELLELVAPEKLKN